MRRQTCGGGRPGARGGWKGRELFIEVAGEDILGEELVPFFEVADIAEASTFPKAEGGRSEAEEGASGPVARVVLRLKAGFCEGGNFITLKAHILQGCAGGVKHGKAVFGRGEQGRYLFLVFVEEGSGLEGEVVEREVSDGEVFQLIEGILPGFECLAGEFVHQVDGDVANAGLRCEMNRFDGSLGGVEAAEGFEEGIIKRLDAEADAIDASGVERGHFFECDIVRVGLECDFTIACEPA